MSGSFLPRGVSRYLFVCPDAGWGEWIDGWLSVLRAAGRPDTTLRLRRYQLERVAEGLAPALPGDVTVDELLGWLAAQDWSAETRRSWRSALRGFYGWAVTSGRCAADPSLALPAVKPSTPNPRPASEDAYRAGLAADERVRLMVRLAAELGLRRGEVARVHRRDLERATDGWVLVVHGKGAKVRRLPIDVGLAAQLRERGPGFAFPGNDHGHLSPGYVGKLVARALPPGWAMHSLRHRFATVAYALERDLLAVQELCGHASPATTRRYVQLPSDATRRLVAAVARL